jgi:hypothetical protein
VSRVDTAIRAAAGVTVAALAGIAGAISYSHMEGLAAAHGEHGWRGHAFPLSVDGIEVVASLVLLADRRAGRRSGWLPWAALVAGTAASFAANIAVGGSDWIGRAVSGWPAFALLTAVKLLFGLLDHPATIDPGQLGAAAVPDGPGMAGTVPALADGIPESGGYSTDDGDGPATAADGRDGDRDGRDGAAGGPEPLPGERLDLSGLMPAGRAARAEILRQGRPVTREALARQLRADGHAASNARVSALLRALAAEPSAPEEAAA